MRKLVGIFLIVLELIFVTDVHAALPTPRDATLKTATQIKFGQTVKISMPDSSCLMQYYPSLTKMKKFCHEGYATAKISSISYSDSLGSGTVAGGDARYAIKAVVSNYFPKTTSGLNLYVTCSNSTNQGNSYSDGKNFNQLPAMSSDSGVAFVGLPDGQSSSSCVKPVIWIIGDSYDDAAEAKKAKTVWAAYIPISPSVFTGH